MKILLISPWNTICGVSEMAHFLVQALEARGHQFVILANRFAGEYQPVGVRQDGSNVHRLFGTGFAPEGERAFDLDRAMELLTAERPDVVALNYQDFTMPDKRRLNGLLQAAKDLGCRTALLLHDDCVSRELVTGTFDYVITPPSVEFFRGVTIDQGIPEVQLSPAHLSAHKWNIACFGLGRNKSQRLIEVVRTINERSLLTLPIQLTIHAARPQQLEHSTETTVIAGYLDVTHLAQHLHDSHACVIWYPEIAGRSTSSAFRFAVGSLVPIICNRSNWVADQAGNGCWIEVPQDTPEAFQAAIIRTFQPRTYTVMRDRMTRLQRLAIQRSGWSEIARQYEALLQ